MATTIELLEKLFPGIRPAPPDHPVYQQGTTIVLGWKRKNSTSPREHPLTEGQDAALKAMLTPDGTQLQPLLDRGLTTFPQG